VANALAYYDRAKLKTVRSFIVQTQGETWLSKL